MKNGNAKLTLDLVRAIRVQGRNGRSAPKIARELRQVTDITMSVESIRRILRGETWPEAGSAMDELALEMAAKSSMEKLQEDMNKIREGDRMVEEMKQADNTTKGVPDAGYD